VGRIERVAVRVLEWWAGILLVGMVVVVTAGVFYRYVLGAALVWYDEFASYLLVWLTFYGAVLASQRDLHIEFDAVVHRMAPAVRRPVEAVSGLCTLAFHLVLLAYGIVLTRSMGAETAISLPWVRMAWVYSALPVSGGLMLAFSAINLARRWRGAGPQAERFETEVA
jgi:TRAP-type C4-dicarboxylate transport system permease small subunit